jgi:hypothetical protein
MDVQLGRMEHLPSKQRQANLQLHKSNHHLILSQ